jgi:hypothetical protein
LLWSCIGMLGVSTWCVAVMHRYVRSIDLVYCGHVSACKEYRTGLLPSCIGMLGVSTWFVAVMNRYVRSIDLVGCCHVSVC